MLLDAFGNQLGTAIANSIPIPDNSLFKNKARNTKSGSEGDSSVDSSQTAATGLQISAAIGGSDLVDEARTKDSTASNSTTSRIFNDNIEEVIVPGFLPDNPLAGLQPDINGHASTRARAMLNSYAESQLTKHSRLLSAYQEIDRQNNVRFDRIRQMQERTNSYVLNVGFGDDLIAAHPVDIGLTSRFDVGSIEPIGFF